MSDNLRTAYHAYSFNLRVEDDKLKYKELCEKLQAQGLKCFEAHGGSSFYRPELDGKEIELEAAFLFENQWNTGPVEGISESGLRVFDWAQDYQMYAKRLKQGHYLEQTDAMREIRRNTVKCGYCGKQEPAAKGYVFCPHCLDSEYLKEGDLRLTRLRPIDESSNEFQPLTDAEIEYLMPLYIEAQLHGSTERGKARLIKQRRDIVRKCENETRNAIAERDGLLWLLDHGIKIDNVIYYNHKGVFSFGWRSPVSLELKSRLLDVLVEFPFDYEIKAVELELTAADN